jgi:hypothetical protein
MGKHFDEDGDGVADGAAPDIGSLENETIFIPSDEHIDPDAEARMQMGRPYLNPGNDLRDPWFHTEEGQAWLAEHEDATAAGEAGDR